MRPLIAPLTTSGAIGPSARSPHKNVVVCQWPCGTDANSRRPRNAQPRVGVMFVFAQVSSRNTNRPARGFVGERGAAGVLPTPAGGGDVGPGLLAGDQRLFLGRKPSRCSSRRNASSEQAKPRSAFR